MTANIFNIQADGQSMAESKKRVLMLLSNPFRPDPRVHKEARSLTEEGYEVTIICWDRTGKYPSKETIDGIRILRIGPIYKERELGKFLPKLFRFWLKAFGLARELRPHIVHAHDFDTLPLGFDISKFHGARLVYDSHEIYTAMLGPDGGSTVLGRFIDRLEGFFMRRADSTITVNDEIASLLRSRGAKASVVTNCPPLKPQPMTSGSLRQKLALGDDFVILYIGVLEPDRFLEEAAKAMAAASPEGIKLVIGGFGTLDDRLNEISKDVPAVKLIGQVDPALVGPYTTECDLVLCVFDPRHNLNNKLGSPNKVFDAMMASKPVMVAKGTYAAGLVAEEKCGVAIDYKPESFLPAVDQLKGSPDITRTLGQQARKAAEQRYNWEEVSKVLLSVYASLR
jgi:glycosyltransferase involved in cell wall biosynthesis